MILNWHLLGMTTRNIDSTAAFRLLETGKITWKLFVDIHPVTIILPGLPLYSPTAEFTSLLALYEACGRAPTRTHPEILAFRERRRQEEENRKYRGFRQNTDAPWIMWQPPNQKKS